MSLKTAGFAALAAVALAAPESLQAKASDTDCPSTQVSAERMQAVEDRIASLDARLQELNALLDSQADARREALNDTETRIREAVHQGELSPEEVDAAVASAIAEANARAQASANAAIAVRRSMEAVRAEMDALDRQVHSMAAAPAPPEEPVTPQPPQG